MPLWRYQRYHSLMASLQIRKLDDPTKSRLRTQAAQHGRSMEEEAREILRSALAQPKAKQGNIAEAIRRRFAPFGGVELPAIERDAPPDAPASRACLVGKTALP